MARPLPIVEIVDDDEHLLRALGRLLSSQGYRLCMFKSAERYLATMEASKAACVVVDLDLGGSMSGLALARAVSSSRRPIPVILVTGSNDMAIRDEAMAMGCAAFLYKPISSEHLINAVRRSAAGRF